MATALALAPAAVRSICLIGAALGTTVWAAALFVLQPDWAAALLLLAPLALTPLALALHLPAAEWSSLPLLGRAGVAGQLPAAVLLACAFLLPPGLRAGLLAAPWFAVTCLIAGYGLHRLRQRGRASPEEMIGDLGMVYLAVGGGWVLLSRAGLPPLGFGEPIVLLTGVHFHYAGFLLPILTGLAGLKLHGGTARLAAAAVGAGVPLVALGITLSPHGIRFVEWGASWFLAAAGLLVTLLQLRLAFRARQPLARGLFAASGLALAAGMVLAAVYALGVYWGREWLTIPDMLPWHGALNALGFAVPGLLAWLVEG